MADPVTLAEARLHLRLPSNITTDEQNEITRLISVATEYAEQFTNRLWTTGSRVETFDAFPYSVSGNAKACICLAATSVASQASLTMTLTMPSRP